MSMTSGTPITRTITNTNASVLSGGGDGKKSGERCDAGADDSKLNKNTV